MNRRSEAFAFITGFSPLERDQKNLGITAIKGSFCHRSVTCKVKASIFRKGGLTELWIHLCRS